VLPPQQKKEKGEFKIMAARQAGGDLDVIDKEEDLDDNDSGVEDASDLDSDADDCQIESLINKQS